MGTSRDAAIRHQRGRQLLDRGKTEEALAEFDAALALQPNYELAYRSRAQTHRALGDLPCARADRQRAHDLSRTRPRPATISRAMVALAILGFGISSGGASCAAVAAGGSDIGSGLVALLATFVGTIGFVVLLCSLAWMLRAYLSR